MLRFRWLLLLPIFLPGAGCADFKNSGTPLVADNPFAGPPAAPPKAVNYAPANTAVAARVDDLGRKIVAANLQLGIRPMFNTVGAPSVEIFHRGSAEIIVTEGLVRQCANDGQLAAVLCLELGKVMSERAALAAPPRRSQERDPLPDVNFSGDNGADRTRLAELAKFSEADRHRAVAPSPLPPDPQALARTYLTNAGFPGNELEGAAPLLKAAETSGALQKQLTAPGPTRPWVQH